MSKENRQGLLKLVPQLLQKLRGGLEDISYSPFETTQLFKQLETLHLARLRSVPKINAAPAALAPNVTVKLTDVPALTAPVVCLKAAVEHVSVVVAASNADNIDVSESNEHAEAVLELAALSASVAQNAAPVGTVANFAQNITQKGLVAEAEIESVPVLLEVVPDIVEPLVPVGATLESLERFVVMSEAPVIAESSNSLPEGDQHLALVGNITQGSWFEMQSEDGQKFRSRLAAIIRATGKYIFVNRSGVKVAEETRMSLALALKSGRLQVLDDGMLFDRALEAVIGNLRNNRPAY
jgi:hypothetical protein